MRFHAARYPATPDVTPLLVTLARCIGRLLARHGVSGGAEGVDVADPWAEETPTLAGLAAASVRGVAGLGLRAGLSVRRCGDPVAGPESTAPREWHARLQGFDLHAGIAVRAGARDRLERLCRYALRPAVGQERLRIWLKRHPRVHFHFIPTSSSWLNLVERWFGEITRDRIRRGTFDSVPALVAAINEYLQQYNGAPRRFVWTKSADMILDKITRCPKPLSA